MSGATTQQPWLSLALSGFFLLVGLLDLFGPDPDPRAAVWELTFALANALFYWIAQGAPAWVRPAAYLLFAAGLLVALSDLFS